MAERPVGKVRVRWSRLGFAFWDNGREMPSMTLTRSWKDDKGEWHNQSISMSRRDLVELCHQLPGVIKAYDELNDKMRGSQKAGEAEAAEYTDSVEFVG